MQILFCFPISSRLQKYSCLNIDCAGGRAEVDAPCVMVNVDCLCEKCPNYKEHCPQPIDPPFMATINLSSVSSAG